MKGMKGMKGIKAITKSRLEGVPVLRFSSPVSPSSLLNSFYP
jgi:hypothetical protein